MGHFCYLVEAYPTFPSCRYDFESKKQIQTPTKETKQKEKMTDALTSVIKTKTINIIVISKR